MKYWIVIAFVLGWIDGKSGSLPSDTGRAAFVGAKGELIGMLQRDGEPDFKRAVFAVENAWFDGQLSYDRFHHEINGLATVCRYLLAASGLDPEISIHRNWAIFTMMTDTFAIASSDSSAALIHTPYHYDFEDYNGTEDWSKMFVTKLLDTKSGNCHSLPFLYKILAAELNAEAYLAFAPNHIYIKHRDELKDRWYNLELTSGTFPMDAWIFASGFISKESVRNGIYMDTLSNRQSVALCLLDLAKGYERKFGTDDFVLDCTNAVLELYPNMVNALLLKAETLHKQYKNLMTEYGAEHPNEIRDRPNADAIFQEMENTYAHVVRLGYREMPEEMYLGWLNQLQVERERFTDKNARLTQLKPNSE